MPYREFETPADLEDFAREKFKQRFEVLVISGKTSIFPIGSDTYSPEPDVAVGPFASRNVQYGNRYDDMAKSSSDFIEKCIEVHMKNINKHEFEFSELPHFSLFYDGTAVNWNARCFVAVEIEKNPSRKHLLGSTINAIALGRVGLLVGFSEDIVVKFLRCLKYLHFLKAVKKSYIEPNNGLVLSKEQFIEILEGI